MISASEFDILSSYIIFQTSLILGIVTVGVFIYEIIPYLFGVKSEIKRNVKDIFYTIGISVYTTVFGILLIFIYTKFDLPKGLIQIDHVPLYLQVAIIVISTDFFTYIFHRTVHKRYIPIFSKAHMFHHEISKNMDWANGRREHIYIMSAITVFSSIVFYFLYSGDPIANLLAFHVLLFLALFSHYRVLISIPVLDKVLLFPKDHYKHHNVYESGPYGIHTSLFDTIFGTRGKEY